MPSQSSPPTHQPTLLAPEACRYISVSLPTLHRLVKQGRVRCTRLSPKGKRIFLVSDLDRFLAEGDTVPPQVLQSGLDLLQTNVDMHRLTPLPLTANSSRRTCCDSTKPAHMGRL